VRDAAPVVRRCPRPAVAPRCTLPIVGHHPPDLRANLRRPGCRSSPSRRMPFDPGEWDNEVAAPSPVPATERGGRPATAHDPVLLSRRRS